MSSVPTPCPCPKEPPKHTPAWRAHIDNARRLACVCQLCDEPVTGKPKVALYCELHRAERRELTQRKHKMKVGNKHGREYQARNREKLRKKARERYQNDPVERERRNAYKRAWRKLNRDKIKAQKQRAALRNFREPGRTAKRWREKVAAGEHKPTPARRNKHGERLCVTPRCRSVMTGRAKKCEKCKSREAMNARWALTGIMKKEAA